MPSDTIGVGVSFPFRISSRGVSKSGIERSGGIEAIKMAIDQILYVQIGERVMRRDFGSRMYDVPFELMDSSTVNLIRRFVVEALVENEKRIDVTNVQIQTVPKENQILVAVDFVIKKTNETGSTAILVGGGV